MARGGRYLVRQVEQHVAPQPVTKAAVTSFVLNPLRADTLSRALSDDARDFYYSACLSFVDATRGISAGFYTWATVKCYYSVFYSLRALLALDNTCVFYVLRSPFAIHASPGSVAKKGKGTSHELVLKLFAEENPSHHLISQEIDLVPALKWMMDRREDSNYRIARFVEPNAPEHLKQAELKGVRRLLCEYLDDENDFYTFDKDHAILAFTLAALAEVASKLTNDGDGISEGEFTFLTSACCDEYGPIAPVADFFRPRDS